MSFMTWFRTKLNLGIALAVEQRDISNVIRSDVFCFGSRIRLHTKFREVKEKFFVKH